MFRILLPVVVLFVTCTSPVSDRRESTELEDVFVANYESDSIFMEMDICVRTTKLTEVSSYAISYDTIFTNSAIFETTQCSIAKDEDELLIIPVAIFHGVKSRFVVLGLNEGALSVAISNLDGVPKVKILE